MPDAFLQIRPDRRFTQTIASVIPGPAQQEPGIS